MINGMNGGSVLLRWFYLPCTKKTVWKSGGHGDEGPGCKPQRNGDLWQ